MTNRIAQVLLFFAFVLPVFASQAGELNTAAETQMVRASWEDARRIYLKLHGVLEKTLGPEDPQTVLALANACDASVPLATRLNSIAICTRALELNEKLAPDSTDTVKTMSDLALLYAAEGDSNHAAKLLERALRITGTSPTGQAAPVAAGLMNNLGTIYFRKGKYTQSREMFEHAVAAVGSGVTADGSDLVTMLSNLGNAELAAHDAGAAERDFRRALSIAKTSFGPNHVKYIQALNNLSRAEAALGNKANALTSSAAMP